jgi:hypothetical protein
MKITIVTLYDDRMVEHYVGAVKGTLTAAQRTRLAGSHESEVFTKDLSEDDLEDARVMYFREVDLHDSPLDLHSLKNMDGTEPG